MTRKRLKRAALLVVALVLVFGGVFAWKFRHLLQGGPPADAAQPPATVAVATVQTARWQPYLRSVGSLVAEQGIAVTTEVGGTVSSVAFESGRPVQAGDLLVQLDDAVDRAELAGLEAAADLARAQFDRIEALRDQRTISQADLDEAQANLRQARARVETRRALIRKKRIVAPFSGLLGISRVDVGEYLEPGAPIVPLESIDPIHVEYTLPERDLAALEEGRRVEVRVQAWPGRTFTGAVTAIDAALRSETRTLLVRATLSNTDALLRPGMFAEVRTVLPGRREVLVLPRTAITYAPYGDAVFLIAGSEALVVERRPVKTGEVRGEQVEIVSGLGVGDRVVTAGQVKLRDGQPVRPAAGSAR